MAIKIGSKIQKLNPTDTYKLVDGADVDGFNTLKGRVDQHDTDNAAIDSRVATAESNASTALAGASGAAAKADAASAAAATNAGAIAAIQGDVSALKTSAASSATSAATAVQKADAASAAAATNAAAISMVEGSISTVQSRVTAVEGVQTTHGAKIADLQLEVGKKISGIHVEDHDRSSAYDGITGLTFGDGFKIHPSNVAEKDALVEYELQLPVGTGVGTPDAVQSLSFPGATVVVSGTEGAKVAAITIPSGGGGSALMVRDASSNREVTDVTQITAHYPLEAYPVPSGGTGTDLPGQAILAINPSAYEAKQGNGCLLKLAGDKPVIGQRPVTLYCDEEIVPLGTYFSLDKVKGGVIVQDTTGDDTAVTGGQLTEILASVAFEGAAPADGTVTVYLEYHDQLGHLPNQMLVSLDGTPVASRKFFKAGELLTDVVIAGSMLATTQAPVVLKVETSFSDTDVVIVDADKTMVCVNQYSEGFETSMARIEFQRRVNVDIIPIMHRFKLVEVSLSEFIEGLTKPEEELPPRAGQDFLNSVGIRNLSAVKAKIENDELTVTNASGTPADYYIDIQVDSNRTTMLRGKSCGVAASFKNPYGAFRLVAYSWTGAKDDQELIYTSRTNDVPTLAKGWVEIDSDFIAESPDGVSVGQLAFTVPADANNIAVVIMPNTAASPSSLTLNVFDFTCPSFLGYLIDWVDDKSTQHLKFSEQYAEFGLDTEQFDSLRYTISNTQPVDGQPMPVGQLLKGKADVTLDNTVNIVPGSNDPENDGAIKFTVDGEVNVSKSYLLHNETNTESTVTFWDVLIDVNGTVTKIPDSEHTYTVPANTPDTAVGMKVTNPAYSIDVLAGQRIGGRATSNKADGAFIYSDKKSEYMVLTVVDFKELSATTSDSPDLVSAPIPKASVLDRRVYSFSGNTQLNVVIPLDIPSDVELADIEVVKHSAGVTTSIRDSEYAYNATTKQLTVHVGNAVATGKIYLTFWSGIA